MVKLTVINGISVSKFWISEPFNIRNLVKADATIVGRALQPFDDLGAKAAIHGLNYLHHTSDISVFGICPSQHIS